VLQTSCLPAEAGGHYHAHCCYLPLTWRPHCLYALPGLLLHYGSLTLNGTGHLAVGAGSLPELPGLMELLHPAYGTRHTATGSSCKCHNTNRPAQIAHDQGAGTAREGLMGSCLHPVV
jgi:hypothetical protein